MDNRDRRPRRELIREADKARLLLEAARYLGETLDPQRVYDRFRELLAEAVPHDGVIVSSYDEGEELIRCDYAWSDGAQLDVSIFPPLPLNTRGGGMQSQVIRTGEPVLFNDVRERVKGEGTYYEVDPEGQLRKVPDTGPPGTRAAIMLPVRHDGSVVGVVQVMSDRGSYGEDELELAEGLVGQMAASVRNARLHGERAHLEAAQAAALAAAAEREHASRVLEAVGDGIFLVDGEGLIGFWNRAAEVVTGLRAKDVRSLRPAQVFEAWPATSAEIPIGERGAAARSVALPVGVNGAELWLSFVAMRSPAGVVYAFRDLTGDRSLEEAKSDFIATVSHELRTPLTAVLGAAKTLLREDVDFSGAQARQLLEMIATQATRLSSVTDDLLLASSLDRGEVRVEKALLDIEDVVTETLEAMQPRVPASTSLVLEEVAAGQALGDRDRVQQVLVNLIDNAVKYSPDGGHIVVSASRLPETVRVSVKDEGLGIAPVEQTRIFEKFYRADPMLTRASAGTGLGLYICRELVQRMGGQIGVYSQAGTGSTFFFDLPAA